MPRSTDGQFAFWVAAVRWLPAKVRSGDEAQNDTTAVTSDHKVVAHIASVALFSASQHSALLRKRETKELRVSILPVFVWFLQAKCIEKVRFAISEAKICYGRLRLALLNEFERALQSFADREAQRRR